MPLSVNTHESAALYQSMAANLRKAHGTMREVLEAPDRAATLPGEAPDRAATLPGEAPDRAATLPKPSTKVTFASSSDKENASPAYQPRKASPPPPRAAATPTTVASFGEEGSDATPEPAPAKAPVVAKPAPVAKAPAAEVKAPAAKVPVAAKPAPVAAKPEKPAEPTKSQQPPAAWAAALAKKKAPQTKKNTSKAAPAPTVYRSGWSESQGSDAHRAAGGTQAHGFGGSPYAADPLRFLPKAAAAPSQPQRVGKFKWPPSPEKPAPKAAPQTPGFDETAPDVSPDFKTKPSPAAAPASVYRSGWSEALPAAAPREGPAACASPGPGTPAAASLETPAAGSLEAAKPLEAAMDSISPLTDEARSLAEGIAAASPAAVESPADAGAVYPESPADAGAVFPASPAEDDGVVEEEEEEEEDELDELEAEKTWPSTDGSKEAAPAPEAAWARVARRRSCARRASIEHGRSPRPVAPQAGGGWAGAWDVLRDALERGASVGAAAESLAAESSTVLSDAQKEDFCDLMAARDFGSCDEHPEDFPSRDLAVEFVEDVKAKAKISDGVAARESGGSTDLSGLFASVDELGPDLCGNQVLRCLRVDLQNCTPDALVEFHAGPDLQTALAAATEVPEEAPKKPSARSLRRAVVAAIRTVAAEHLAPRVVSYDEATGLYGVDCRVTVEDGSVVRMAVERDFTDFVRCRAGLVEKLATTAHGRTLVGKLNKVPKKRVRSLLKAKARDAVQGGGAGETKWQRKQRPWLQRWLDSAVIVVRDCKRAERYATQPFGAGDAEDIALETEDYFKCFLLQGAVYRGLDAIDPIINVDDL